MRTSTHSKAVHFLVLYFCVAYCSFVMAQDYNVVELKGEVVTTSGKRISFDAMKGFKSLGNPTTIEFTSEIDQDYVELPKIMLYLTHVKSVKFGDEVRRTRTSSSGNEVECSWRSTDVQLLDGSHINLACPMTTNGCGGAPQFELTFKEGVLERVLRVKDISEINVEPLKTPFQPSIAYRGYEFEGELIYRSGNKVNVNQIRTGSPEKATFTEGIPSNDELGNAVKLNIHFNDITSIDFGEIVSFEGAGEFSNPSHKDCHWIETSVKLRGQQEPLNLYLRSRKQWMMASGCGPTAEKSFTFVSDGFVIKYLNLDIIDEIRFNR